MKQIMIPAGEGDQYGWSQDHLLVKVPHTLTNGHLTVVEDTLKPGFHLARHYHKSIVEIFYILDGKVEFEFDDQTVLAKPGTTICIPPTTWHAVSCPAGACLLTLFSPGGFEDYLAEVKALTPEQLADEFLLTALAEQHDIWTR